MRHVTEALVSPPRTSARPPSAEAADITLTLLGPSAAMAQLWSQVRRLAPHMRTLLLTGEADCGQEAVARLLLELSPSRTRMFVRLSAAEIDGRLLRPAGLSSLPTEIFLFLPDVERLSAAGQDAVLRLLRQRRSRGFTLVAASSENLHSLVSLGRFSSELADALGAIALPVPCLRDRSEDLPMLIQHLLSTLSATADRPVPVASEAFLLAAMEHGWTGNLRELKRTLGVLCSEDRQGVLEPADLLRAVSSQAARFPSPSAPVRLVSLDTVVQEHIGSVLHACRGNKLRAAEVLGISRSTLYRMLDAGAIAAAGHLAPAV